MNAVRDTTIFVSCRIFLLCCLSFLYACASVGYQFSDLTGLREATDPANSTYDSSFLTAAIWVDNQPLLVNTEFNFGMAMSLEGVGPAIAAGMRIKENKELAAKLGTMAPLNLNGRAKQLLHEHAQLAGDYNVSVFAVLYGQPEAQLYTFLELTPLQGPVPLNTGPLHRYVHVSGVKAIEGGNGWVDDNGKLIDRQVKNALLALAQSVRSSPPGMIPVDPQEFTIAGLRPNKKQSGTKISWNENTTTVRLLDIPNTVALYPSGLVGWAE